MKYSLVILSALFLTFSCNQSQSDRPLTLEEYSKLEGKEAKLLLLSTLKEKYNEEFIVIDFYFEMGLNTYVFYAAPDANNEIVFYGNFDEREASPQDRIGHDSYPNEKFGYAATSFYKSLFKNDALSHVAAAEVYSYYEHTWGEQVPSWDEYLLNRNDKSSIGMNTYYFEVPDNPDHPIITQQKIMLEALQNKYQNNFSLYVGFWPKGFLEDKKLEELTFGFQSTTEKDADNILNLMQYLSKVLLIKIVHSSVDGVDEEMLFDLIKDDNKQGINEMIEI